MDLVPKLSVPLYDLLVLVTRAILGSCYNLANIHANNGLLGHFACILDMSFH